MCVCVLCVVGWPSEGQDAKLSPLLHQPAGGDHPGPEGVSAMCVHQYSLKGDLCAVCGSHSPCFIVNMYTDWDWLWGCSCSVTNWRFWNLHFGSSGYLHLTYHWWRQLWAAEVSDVFEEILLAAKMSGVFETFVWRLSQRFLSDANQLIKLLQQDLQGATLCCPVVWERLSCVIPYGLHCAHTPLPLPRSWKQWSRSTPLSCRGSSTWDSLRILRSSSTSG